MEYVTHKHLSMKAHPELTEKWLQDRIDEYPELLGLGEVVVRDKERIRGSGGRLDLLLEDSETDTRYEVEIQLGSTDASHIVRTIEYWDTERRRFPQYDHVAVIVAEDITARFFNVISLFNGHIPIIAIQVQAIEIKGKVTLVFAKILDRITLGTDAEDDAEPTDRAFWERTSTPAILELSDRILETIRQEVDPQAKDNYTKFYIGLFRGGLGSTAGLGTNCIVRRPKKNHLLLEIRLPLSEDRSAELEESGIEPMSYYVRYKSYRMKLTVRDLEHEDRQALVRRWIRDAYDHEFG